MCWEIMSVCRIRHGLLRHALRLSNGVVRRLSSASRYHTVQVHSQGCLYRVPYLDEGPPGGATALAVHGTPGGATDFDGLSEKLQAQGVRVIVPTMTGNPLAKLCEGKPKFFQSTQFKAQFVIDFMEALALDRVDVILGHSLGGTPALQVAATTDRAKGLVLINSISHIVHNTIKPYWLHQLVGETIVLGIPLLSSFLFRRLVAQYAKVGFRETDKDHILAGYLSHTRLQFPKLKHFAEQLAIKQMPLLCMVCKNDKLLERHKLISTAELAGVNTATKTSYFDENRQLVEGPSLDDVIPSRCLVFALGGHLAHVQHTDAVAKCVMDLIQSLR